MTTRYIPRTGAVAIVLAVTSSLGVAHAAAPSTTTTTVAVQTPSFAYGDTTKVTVSVETADKGPKPAGKFELTIGDKTLIADVGNSGKVDFDWPLVDAATYPVTAVFVPTDPMAFSTSTSAPVNTTVTKDATTSTLLVTHKREQRKVVAKDIVVSAKGQGPIGNVKFILRRNGIKFATKTKALDPAGGARFVFRKVKPLGKYTVIAKYAGSVNFEKSKAKFVIPPVV